MAIKIARVGAALGIGVLAMPAIAGDQPVNWKPATSPATLTSPAAATMSPIPTTAPTRGLVFNPVNPVASQVNPFALASSPMMRPNPGQAEVTWQAVQRPAIVGTPTSPVQAGELPIPRSLPDQLPMVPVPSDSPGPKLSPRLTPTETGSEAASGWSNQVWGTRVVGPVEPGPVVDGVIVEGFTPVPSKPVRYHGASSPNVTLNRDFYFLDIFGLPLLADGADTVVVGEGPPGYDSYIQAEYLLWWLQSGTIPILATTSNDGGFGFLGEPGSVPLLGPGQFGPSLMDGFRIRAGTWIHGGGHGIDASFFFLGRRTDGFAVGSDTTPTITRPFFAPNPGVNGPFGEQIAFPGQSTGFLTVDSSSSLWGADINLLQCVCRTCDSRSAAFLGFRHLNLDEGVGITEAIAAGPTAPLPQGTTIIVQDTFNTRNRFYGPQFGWTVGRTNGRFDVDARVSVALGSTRQELDIDGFQVVTPPGGDSATFRGGLLAAGPNLGTFTRDRFSVVPEFTVNLGYLISPRLRTYVGYNLIYWSDVIRPGQQIDTTVDLTFVPNAPAVPFSGQPRPQPLLASSDMWIQGINFGVELRW